MKILFSKPKRCLASFVVFAILISNLPLTVFAARSFPPNPSIEKAGIDMNNVNTLLMDNISKQSLSEPKKKLATDLLKLVDESFLLPNQDRSQVVSQMKDLKQFVGKTASVKSVDKRAVNKAHADLVYVYVSLESSAKTSVIDSIVWKVTDRDEENHLAVAFVEVNKLETLASLVGVMSISSVLPPVTHSGSVMTEGDIIHKTATVRSAYAQSGAGIKIGVISDGVDNVATSISRNDLPNGVTVLGNSHGGDEGTAMLETIYDMVPSASLYFHDCGTNVVAFNSAIDDLIAAGVNVIVDDMGWKNEPYFEDGIVAAHVAAVLSSKNIVYVSAAGNDGGVGYSSGHYQGNYFNNGNNFQDFSGGSQPFYKYLYVSIPAGESVSVVLQWNDSFGSSGNDYDLRLVDENGYRVIADSLISQDGNDNPLESLYYRNDTGGTIEADIWVNNYLGQAASKTLELFVYPSYGTWLYSNNLTPQDSIYGHPAVTGIIAVGAIDANDPGNENIEPYSSQGPVTIIGQGQRPKPDIAGIDCVSVTGVGGFGSPFCGTSAAAPHVAAVVAQLWAQYPSATANQIRNHILNSAVDLGSSGVDNIFGHGRADSLLSFQSAPSITSFNFAGLTPQVTGVVNNASHTVTLTVPNGTSITALVPTIAITGSSVSPSSGVAKNFTSPVTYTVTDATNLTQAYTVTVTIAAPTTHTISGTVKYYDGVKSVPNAIVILENAVGTQLGTTTTDANGAYLFTGVAHGGNYVIRVSKSVDTSGLSGTDQTKIRRHIVRLEIFDTIYKIIAGDVNLSGSLTGTDQIKIRRFIVGLDANLPSGAWKFYPSNSVLDSTNYLTISLARTYTDLTADTSNQDFIGIKMGDVNKSWVSN